MLRLVGRIYDAALEPRRWRSFVDDLADLYSGAAAITTQDSLGVAAHISAASGIDPSFARSYEAYYVGKRPWGSRVSRVAIGEIFTPRTLFDQNEYERTEYFNDWLKPQGIYYLSSYALAKDGPGTTFLTLSRGQGRGDFATAELQIAGGLVPHLQRALEMHRRLFAVTQQRDLLAQGLEGLGIGAILVDLDSRIRFANSIAETFLCRGDGLIARQERLLAKTPIVTNTLHRLIRAAARTGAGLGRASGGVLALGRPDGSYLHALICPFPMNKVDWAGRLMPSALIFVSDATRNVVLRPSHLQQLYGLTRAEAKLMSALASGKTLDEYVEEAGIGRTTAKTQLQRIFMKTDWHRQSDVVRGALASGIAQIAATTALR